MANELGQEQSGEPDTKATVADPLDPANSTNSGDESPLAQFEAEIEDLASSGFKAVAETQESGQEQSAEESEESESEQAEEQAEESQEGEESEEDEGADEQESEQEQAEARVPDRFRFKSDEDRAVAALAKAKGISLVEAAKVYSGMTGKPDSADSQAAENAAPDSPSAADLKKQIAALEDEELEAIRLVDVDRQVEIKLKLRELNKQAQEREAEESQLRIKETQRLEADYEAHCKKAVDAYPGLKDPESAIFKRVAELDRAAKENGDPVFTSTSKLWDLGRIAAKELGIPMSSTVKTPTTVPKAPSKKSVTTSMKPASSNARTTSASPTQGFQAKIDAVSSVDDFESLVGAMAD